MMILRADGRVAIDSDVISIAVHRQAVSKI